MSTEILLLVLLAVLMSSLAQVLFKQSITAQPERDFFASFRNPLVLTGLALYGLYFVALTWAYRIGGELSSVFPLTALAYAVVPALGFWWLGERWGRRTVLGLVVVFAGCALFVLPR